ncbi:MAG: Fe-S protein assembly chaperone HscA [Cellvibrionales bacterium TMED122]|nr:Fe-S protein assembly chaperone HscA [Halieaceae bacterium]OUV61173.1 MAG: Fe-S protein assembly chaperone HscA [Cellvibrionales bacterium TMED122]
MVLLQIAEPGAGLDPDTKRKVAVGIDLGTTNSLIAHFDGASLQVLQDGSGSPSLSSVVYFGASDVRIGQAAMAQASAEPANTIASAKRMLGRARGEFEDDPYVTLAPGDTLAFATAAGAKTPVEVAAAILAALRERAEPQLDAPISGAVITVPAYFDDAQRQATRQAAELAGIKVLRLLNEPTAAAVAYGLDEQAEESSVLAVYDLGGGTFDVSLLRMRKGIFEVLATGGDSALGGDDFDRALADHLLAELALANPSSTQRRKTLQSARDAKEALTEQESVTLDVSDLAEALSEITIDRSVLESLIAPFIERTLHACRETLADAEVAAVDRVVLVGGSTRTPSVRQAVAECFGLEPLCSLDPDQVVAMGAARQADILVGNRAGDEALLLDVIPLSLGLETYGGLVERIIDRNSTIPVARAQEFTTARDGQTGLIVHVVQGERERVEDCRSLAQFELKGIPPMVAGAARIEVTFRVDADGILEVTALEQETGARSDVVVKPAFGLRESQITEMLKAGYEHAGEDMQARKLGEAQVEAEGLLAGLRAALAKDGDLLSDAELRDLEQNAAALEAVMDGNQPEAIRDATESLGRATETFAARRMDRSIQAALQGVAITDLESDQEQGDGR